MPDFFSWFLRMPYKLIIAIRANPIGMFIYGIFAKWYIVFTIASILVLYWALKGLQSTGILDAAFAVLVKALNESKAIAQNCTPKILNINAFWNCLSDPGAYQQAPGEQELNNIANSLQDLIDQNNTGKPTKMPNPYGK